MKGILQLLWLLLLIAVRFFGVYMMVYGGFQIHHGLGLMLIGAAAVYITQQ